MNIKELIDDLMLSELIHKGFIKKTSHGSVSVYNYTSKTQYENVWNSTILMCRGIVVDNAGNILGRPFAKFFNFDQLESVPNCSYQVFEKLDGSLGIVYPHPDGNLAISTRGNPASEQAQWASNRLLSNANLYEAAYELIKKQITPLVEIIYPGNRHVVDYGQQQSIPLIATINNETGKDEQTNIEWPDGTPEEYDISIEEIQNIDRNNAEGYVIHWQDGTRAKVKHHTYQKLHSIIFNCSVKTIWEMLKDHKPVQAITKDTPKEIQNWILNHETRLKQEFTQVEQQVFADLQQIDRTTSRKEQAEHVKQTKYPGILFAILDSKPYSDKIWSLIKPQDNQTIDLTQHLKTAHKDENAQ